MSQAVKFLAKLISIPSVSTDSSKKQAIKNAVEIITTSLKEIGFQINLFKENNCPPLIVASLLINKSYPTLGFYAHYDVQPADPLNLWQSSPFKLEERDNKFFGRGVADDKGHLAAIIEAVKQAKEEGRLKNNLVLIFEGEEEVGSVHFEKLIKKAAILKKVAGFYVVDMGARNKEIPQIYYGLRGIVDFELFLTNKKGDLHSGLWGNLVANPNQIAAEIFAKMKAGETNKIFLPHFFDDVKKISNKEKKALEKLGPVEGKIYPSMEINGWLSGYIGEGIKTIIPGSTIVKFSFRLVPEQKGKKIVQLVSDFIKRSIPKDLGCQLKILSVADPFYTDINNPFVKKTAAILKETFGNETVYNRSGGSIPAAEVLQRLYKKPIVLLGFTLEESNLHAPNENFDKEMFFKGILSLKKILTS